MLFEKKNFEINLLSDFSFSVRGLKNQIIGKSENFIMEYFGIFQTENDYLIY